jgi:hypothetical protein
MGNQIVTEPKFKGRSLNECNYKELKLFADYLKIDFKSLPKLNENNLRKAIRETYKAARAASYTMFVDDFDESILPKPGSHIPFDQLRDVSMTFRVCYAKHFEIPEEDVIKKLGIQRKSYVDKVWHYDGTGYKQKIIDYINARKT